MIPPDLGMNDRPPPGAETLRQAFRRFEQVSSDLAGFYRHLEERVAGLTRELERSHDERLAQTAVTERLAVRLKNLLDALPGGVVVLDGEGRVREFNPVATGLLGGLTTGELWRDIVARAFAPRWDDGHDISLANGRRVNLSTQSLRGEPGQILLLKDVTETRGLQDELARHKRLAAMGELGAALAHQVRTPLASAILHLSNLRRPQIDEALRMRLSEQALDRLKHIERLVGDMLLFARGGAFEAAEVDLDALLAELAADPGSVPEDFKIRLVNRAGAVRVRANRDALASALRNLIDNAARACEGSGRMEIAVTRHPDGIVEMRFADDGPGIPASLRESVFEPFFTTRAQGTGLGLAVTQSVVRAHGGEITLEPPQSAGTVFLVRLPAAEGPPPGSEPAAGAAAGGRRNRRAGKTGAMALRERT